MILLLIDSYSVVKVQMTQGQQQKRQIQRTQYFKSLNLPIIAAKLYNVRLMFSVQALLRKKSVGLLYGIDVGSIEKVNFFPDIILACFEVLCKFR